MSIRKAAMATMIAASMVGAPTIAQAAQANPSAASKLSVRSPAVARQGAAVQGENDLRGGSIIIAILAAAAVIAAIAVAAGGGNNGPASP